MAQLELPLPELVAEDFTHNWTWFEWNKGKQLAVIPTLLRGKLIDYFVDLNDATIVKSLSNKMGTKWTKAPNCFIKLL